MEPQYNTNSMKLKTSKDRLRHLGRATLCITLGTVAGVVTYYLFLFFHIDIFGWNLGLIFAPLVAGYVETFFADKLIGESIGAISAFILFIITVIYGFIIANPTLGFNAITFGSIIVIAQAAFPTMINYMLLVVVLGVISYILGFFKKITTYMTTQFKKLFYKYILKKEATPNLKKNIIFNEFASSKKINSLPFIFITGDNALNKSIKQYLGPCIGTGNFERKPKLISEDYAKDEKELLVMFKEAKNEALINLYEFITKKGGNGVVNLKIEYELMDPAKGQYQVIAHGTGVLLR